ARFFAGTGGTYTSPAEDFGTLVQNGDGSFTYTAKDQTQRDFNGSGQLTAVVDAHGLTLRSYTYASSGGGAQVTALDGGVTAFTYDTTGFLRKVTEPGGRAVGLLSSEALVGGVYQATLLGLTDEGGMPRSFAYDANHHLTEDAWAPLDTQFSYDPVTGL